MPRKMFLEQRRQRRQFATKHLADGTKTQHITFTIAIKMAKRERLAKAGKLNKTPQPAYENPLRENLVYIRVITSHYYDFYLFFFHLIFLRFVLM